MVNLAQKEEVYEAMKKIYVWGHAFGSFSTLFSPIVRDWLPNVIVSNGD